jgi:hypothetical protein
MPRGKTFTAEQIIGKVREPEFGLAQGKTVPEAAPKPWRDGADLLPLKAGVRWAANGPGKAAEGP